MLEIKVKDWGPKPFRFINAWLSHPGFKKFVIDKWTSYKMEGWGSFVLKEKSKRLKADLKTWNKEIFCSLDKQIEERRQKIKQWDAIDDILGLEEEEIAARNRERAPLFNDVKNIDNLLS
ncbi:hypothetical protein ACS0TY_030651 [Phlomoides rotata]